MRCMETIFGVLSAMHMSFSDAIVGGNKAKSCLISALLDKKLEPPPPRQLENKQSSWRGHDSNGNKLVSIHLDPGDSNILLWIYDQGKLRPVCVLCREPNRNNWVLKND